MRSLEQSEMPRLLSSCPRRVLRVGAVQHVDDFPPASLLVVERGIVVVAAGGGPTRRIVLADYRQELDAQGAERVLAIGTSAIRDAENGEAFLGEVEWSYGWKTRLLTGEEEANLTCKGVADGHPLDSATLILDIGGGSTELITAETCVSLDIGSVRLTERFLTTDPPTREELDACAAAVRDALPGLEPTSAIGVAGTITTLAALELGRYDPEQIHGRRLSREEVEAQLERLASVPVAGPRGPPRPS